MVRDMTEHNNNPGAASVVIAGGGVAGLEALLALRALAGDRVNLTLVAPQDSFVDRPMTVAQPFGLGSAARYPLAEIATEAGAEFVRGRVMGVEDGAHQVRMAQGPDLEFDTLILAPGTRQSSPSPNVIAFGLDGSGQAIAAMLERLRSGQAHVVTFAAPSTTGWLLPLYELALMTAREVARSHVDGVRLRLVSPEARPLALFGDEASASVAGLLAASGIEYVPTHYTSAQGGGIAVQSPDTDYVVTLPTLEGPELAGVPSTQPHGFIPVDEYGRVLGLSDVYAAGDAVDFPVKQGGLAAQQADCVALHVAASYGASVEPSPFAPALRGMLFTGGEPLYMRSAVPGTDPDVAGAWYPLWWPPTKVAGRYLAPYLFARGEDEGFGGPPIGFIDVDIPLSAVTLPG
jgi:sulfide:quinone oxidoreductase